MPANLTAQFRAAETRLRNARTPDEKLEALQEMLREIPKHKGTDHMQADIKKKMSQVRKEMGKKSGTARTGNDYHIPREGAGQVILVGPPNSGKSMILDRLSKAKPKVADFPYTTHNPQPCMVRFENIQIQMIDTPPISKEFFESWLPGLVRNADLVVFFLDLSSDELLDDYETVLNRLEKSKLRFEANPTQRFDAEGLALKKTSIVGNKCDTENASANLDFLKELVAGKFEITPISAKNGEGIESWLKSVFIQLEKIRIYTKQPGKNPELNTPVLLKKGATVDDFARNIHKDFEHNLKYAKIWGEGKYDGQMVNRDYVLSDEDILELHM